MTVTYDAALDVLLLEFAPATGKPNISSGAIEIWVSGEGNIDALALLQYTKLSDGFRKALKTAELGGMWKGVRVTEADIQETRQQLLNGIEEKLYSLGLE